MNKIVVLLFLLLPLAGCSQEELPSSLGDTIEKMIVLADTGRGAELLEKHADMRKHGAEQKTVPADKMTELKQALIVAKSLTPKMQEGDSIAIFEDPSLKRTMKFILLDGVWRLQN